jgi:hypothetical protein
VSDFLHFVRIRVRECELIKKGPEHTLAEEETGGRELGKTN